MKTSLIIPSYNPALKLPQTLDALIGQHELLDELIVVVDKKNYSGEVSSMLKKYSGIFKLKTIVQDISGRGISRNKGVEISTGDILIFLDDDMLAGRDLIKKHIEHHIAGGELILTGNGFRNPEKIRNDFDKFLIKMEQGWKEKLKNPEDVTLNNFHFTACNLSLPKKVFMQIGGFDTRFSDGEDFDFAVRALNSSVRIHYDNSLNAWHNDWPDIKALIRRQMEYTKGKKEIFRIHPEYLNHFLPMLPKENSWIKKIIAVIFKSPVTRFVTSGNSIFANLPLKIKCMLYNLTIAFNTSNEKSD